MKKEFTEDQLVYIRDIFAEQCEKYIDLGKRDDAQEALDIINVVQSKMNCDEYDSLETWVLDDSESYGFIELAEPSDYEIAAIDKMKEFAKSSETEPSDMLRDSVNAYLKVCYANIGLTPRSILNKRRLYINRLIILCMKSCTNDELKKLDDIINILAEDRRH
mgnify:CR=1 FL=1